MSINVPIKHKHSNVAGNTPTSLLTGELAVNSASRSIFTYDGTTVVELARDIFRSSSQPSSPRTGDLWLDTSTNSVKYWNGSKWSPFDYYGSSPISGNLSSSTGFASGSGTLASPYTYSSNFVLSVGAERQMLDTLTLTGLLPNQIIELQDQNSSTNQSRFSFSNSFSNSSGSLTFSVSFSDSPSSSSGATFTLLLTVGGIYVSITVQLLAVIPQSINYPTSTLPTETYWYSPDTTLTSSGCLLISLDNVTFSTGPLTLKTGSKLYTKWDGAPGSNSCIDSSHGTTISGSITDSYGAVATSSLTIDKVPNPFSFVDQTGVPVSTQISSNAVTLSGFNSYVYPISPSGCDFSLNSGSWVAAPSAASSSVYLVEGGVLQVRQSSSSSPLTASNAAVTVTSVSDTFTVTTIQNTPSVATPSILTPIADSTGISKTPTLTSSAYSPVNGALGHLNSDWEIYSDSTLTTLVTSSMASVTNLTSWNPSGLAANTAYWARVRHRSSDPLTSSWSNASKFTTEQVVNTITVSSDLFSLLVSDNSTVSISLPSLANQAFIAHFAMDDICDPPQFISPSPITYICNPRSDTSPRTHYETTGDSIIDSGDNAGSQISSLPKYKSLAGSGQTVCMGMANSTGSFILNLNGAKLTDSVLFFKIPSTFLSAPHSVVGSFISGIGSGCASTVSFTAPYTGYYIAFLCLDISSGSPLPGSTFPLLDPNYYPKITAKDNTSATSISVSSNLPLIVPNSYNKVGGLILHQVLFQATSGHVIEVKSISPPKSISHTGMFMTVVGFNA